MCNSMYVIHAKLSLGGPVFFLLCVCTPQFSVPVVPKVVTPVKSAAGYGATPLSIRHREELFHGHGHGMPSGFTSAVTQRLPRLQVPFFFFFFIQIKVWFKDIYGMVVGDAS